MLTVSAGGTGVLGHCSAKCQCKKHCCADLVKAGFIALLTIGVGCKAVPIIGAGCTDVLTVSAGYTAVSRDAGCTVLSTVCAGCTAVLAFSHMRWLTVTYTGMDYPCNE